MRKNDVLQRQSVGCKLFAKNGAYMKRRLGPTPHGPRQPLVNRQVQGAHWSAVALGHWIFRRPSSASCSHALRLAHHAAAAARLRKGGCSGAPTCSLRWRVATGEGATRCSAHTYARACLVHAPCTHLGPVHRRHAESANDWILRRRRRSDFLQFLSLRNWLAGASVS